MIRTLFASAMCGALLLCSTVTAYAEDLTVTTPASPSPAPQLKLAANTRTAAQQVGTSTQVTATGSITGALGAAITRTQALTATASLTPGLPVTATADVTPTAPTTNTAPASSLPTPTSAASLTTTGEITTTGALTDTAAALNPALDAQYAGVLDGTIIANRTEANVRFFVEGQVYDLAPLRALGLPLLRPTAVLNLFNCDARQSESDTGCYWDPYLLKQEGFYEVVPGEVAGALVSLSLREAGAPPANQIWVQNRTGGRESIIVNNEVMEIAPASVQQFTFEGEGPVIVNLRNCISQGEQTACEWAPQGVDPGYYYALVKLTTAGANNTTVSTSRLEGVVASSGEVVERPAQASCLLRVPTLNVRGGPGLEFPIIAKVRGGEEQPGSVVVTGFDASKEWMQVSDRIAQGGWVTSNPDFIICTGDMAALPVEGSTTAEAAVSATPDAEQVAAEATAEAVAEVVAVEPVTETAVEPIAETPVEPVVEEVPAQAIPADPAAESAEAAPDAATAPASIPAGQARLVVNNGFDQVVRFTLDQTYRVELDNLTGEWDLQPGQSISILVYPGMIPFSVSTPWRGLSDNADVTVEADQERALWLYFIPDPDGSGNWILQF